MVPNFTSSYLWPSIRQVAESHGHAPSMPVSPPGHLPREQLRAGSTFPAGFSLTAESSRTGVNWHPLEVQECSPWDFFPAIGRNQTLSKLIVLHSEELSSGISEQRNSLPCPISLSNTDWVSSPRSYQQISCNRKLSGRAQESTICNSNPFVYSSQVGTYNGLVQRETFIIFHRN